MINTHSILYVAVIGGGASGLMSAVIAAREARKHARQAEIRIYEGNSRVGKKILVTGNGRCNFSNEHISETNFHGESLLAYSVYRRFDNNDVIDFFHSLGLFSKSDVAGRIYPMSFQATAVLDALRYECAALGIKEITDTKITSIHKSGTGFLLNNSIYADKCIIATGGKAAPVQGSDGSGFSLLEPFGIEVTQLYPALTPLVCDNFTKSLKGIRAQGKISVKCDGRILSEDTGEIQYTDYGLSGIPSMQVSRFAAEGLSRNKNGVFAVVDSAPYFEAEELKKELLNIVKNQPTLPGEMLLAGIMPKRLGIYLLAECSVNTQKEIGKLHTAVIDKIVALVKNKKYKISSVKGFSEAQVTSGGIKGKEIDAETMELKKVKGVYVCGEIVNVDGDCGGYNLQWAWSSAYVAGVSVVKES